MEIERLKNISIYAWSSHRSNLTREVMGALPEIIASIERARDALETINEFNNIRNDVDAYLHDVALWGMNDDDWKRQMKEEGKSDEKPNPEGYGL